MEAQPEESEEKVKREKYKYTARRDEPRAILRIRVTLCKQEAEDNIPEEEKDSK